MSKETLERKKMGTGNNNEGGAKSLTKENDNTTINKGNNNDTQRALVLQGGGALAAYEVGVYGTLYFWIKKEMEKRGSNNEHVFDVISGTSGGAINGWIVINHVVDKITQGFSIVDSWKGSFKKLLDFWGYTSSSPDFTKWGPYSIGLDMIQSIPGFPPYPVLKWTTDEKSWISRWDLENEKSNNSVASGEAARRYYSSKEYLYSGADNVFSRLPREHDNRFFDDFFPPSNIWHRYSNKPLRVSIEKFSSLESIATTTYSHGTSPQGQENNKKKEIPGPRLLVVAVDVEKGQDVTFDSYEKEDGTRKTVYREYDDDYDDDDNDVVNEQQRHQSPSPSTIGLTYNKGITLDHVMASASVPVNYDYASVHIDSNDLSKYNRKFWDGGILSNTPLRELIQSHEDYWNAKKSKAKATRSSGNNGKSNNPIPNLEVYIANIWPGKWENIPLDHDGVKDRRYDLTYKDKTMQEEKIAYLIHDYIELANKLKDFAKENLAKKRGATEKDIDKDIDDYLKKYLVTRSKHRDGKPRTPQQLLENKLEITKVIRIERRYDPNDISYKWCDYSCDTVTHMIERGIVEALENIVMREKKEKKQNPKDFNTRKEELGKFIDLVDREKEAEGLTQKQTKILTRPAADLLKNAAISLFNNYH
jgi:NTE family protein